MKQDLMQKMNTNLFQLFDIGRYIMKKATKDKNITVTHLMILRFIANYDNLNVGTLVKYLECDQGNLSTTLKKLEKKGFIERKRNPLDERQVNIYITKSGDEIVRQVDDELYQFIMKITPQIPIEELEGVVNRLSEIVKISQQIIKENKEEK